MEDAEGTQADGTQTADGTEIEATGGPGPYQSLYRRYRPQRFADVRGQEHVTRALLNSVRDGKVAHAYLFSGPRGTGKTSTARILAMALNCEHPLDGEPDGTCESCQAIRAGSSLDVHELDAASNRRIDEMRDLLGRVALGTTGRWKVYIVDEVHQLTSDAASALLKTLEEPPAHVIFVLATTDPQRVLPTIRSRTQHFEFHLLGADVLSGLLGDVNAQAGLGVAPEAIDLVVRRGHGSARDALSVLDQVAAAGVVDDEVGVVSAIVDALADHDVGRVLVGVAESMNAGRDPRRLAADLLEHLRNGFLATQARALVLLSDDAVVEVEAQARRIGLAALVRAMEVIGQAATDMRDAVDPRVTLEAALVRAALPAADTQPAALLARIEQLERRLAEAGGAGGSGAGGGAARSGGEAGQAGRGAGAGGRGAGGGGARSGSGAGPAGGGAGGTGGGAAGSGSDAGPAGGGAGGTGGRGAGAGAAPTRSAGGAGGAGESDGGAGVPGPPAGAGGGSAARTGGDGGSAVGEAVGAPRPEGPRGVAPARQGRPSLGAPPPMPGRGAAAPPPRPSLGAAPPIPRPSAGERPAGERQAGGRVLGVAPTSARGVPPAPAPLSHPGPPAGPAPAGPAAGAGPAGPGATLPTRDELTLAWGDAILAGLPGRVRAYVQLGRFVASGPDAAVYALPDAGLLGRAETVRGDFERALTAHFGRSVPVRLVLDDTPSPLADPGTLSTPSTQEPSVQEEDPRDYVLAEMEDATAVVSPEQRLLQAFPGAEEVTP